MIVLLTGVGFWVEIEAISNQHIQAERIKSALTTTEFASTGARSSLIVLVSGTGSYCSDRLACEVESPCMIWSPQHNRSRLSLAAGARGFVLRVPEKVIGRAMPTGSISAHVRSVVGGPNFLPSLPDLHLDKLQFQFERIESELFDMAPGAFSAVDHCISLLLIEIWRASSPPHPELDTLPQSIVDHFLHLVELHLQDHWAISQYAHQIGVSRDRLNSAVRRAIGISPYGHIQSRLVDEAKSLLLNSNLHVAEIAYKLGFADAAYFNRFFQRHTAVPPGRFRNISSTAHDERQKESSFAAWP